MSMDVTKKEAQKQDTKDSEAWHAYTLVVALNACILAQTIMWERQIARRLQFVVVNLHSSRYRVHLQTATVSQTQRQQRACALTSAGLSSNSWTNGSKGLCPAS